MPEDADRARRRIFTYDEAARILPDVRRLTEAAYRAVEALSAEGGAAAATDVDALVTKWARDVISLGIDVKGLWLVDFDNGSGYYCWKFPEEGLQFFHTYEEGFRGRTRIH
jgi:hypothetical protein